MSILIKGMEMPKTHPLTVTIYPDGQVLSETVGAKDIHGNAIPAADVRPVVHGKWIRGNSWSEGCGMGEIYGFYYKCSVCKDVVQGGYKDCGMKYCSNCGADMREDGE